MSALHRPQGQQVIPDEAVEAARAALVSHQRQSSSACLCGWSERGKSHADHQAHYTLEAAAPFIATQAWDEAIQLADDEGCLIYHQAKGIKSLNPYRSQP